jgi:hypothetical protein
MQTKLLETTNAAFDVIGRLIGFDQCAHVYYHLVSKIPMPNADIALVHLM